MAIENKETKIIEPVVDAQSSTAADVDAIMRKYDRESNTRVWEGKPKIVVNAVLTIFSLFCIYVTLFANFMEQTRLSSFLGFVVIIGFLTYPAKKGNVKVNQMDVENVDFEIFDNDIISIRYNGKFKIFCDGGKSRKDRIFIKIAKY